VPSSITDRERHSELGQVLPIFAFALVALLSVAALVFDVGHDLLQRRATQNAADAAALAGARYMDTPSCRASSTPADCLEAVDAAFDVARRNGYQDGVGDVTVRVNIPPAAGSSFQGLPGHIQVIIHIERRPFFASIVGITERHVTSSAVATNSDGVTLPYSFLALDPHACAAGRIAGNASVDVGGTIYVNSDCAPNAFFFEGSNLTVNADGCGVVGDYYRNPVSVVNCGGAGTPPVEDVPSIVDPLAAVPEPPLASQPQPPAAVQILAGHATAVIPDYCPGASSGRLATLADPHPCELRQQKSTPTTYRLHPGVYPGGIRVYGNATSPVIVYLEPGIYYLAGGGWIVEGNGASLVTVAAGTTSDGGGILIFNSEVPDDHAICLTTPLQPGCIGPIRFAGASGGGRIYLEPYENVPWENLLIFQDRDAAAQPQVEIQGTASVSLAGTIYAAGANVDIAGGGSGLAVQVIAKTFSIRGNGTLSVSYDADSVFRLVAVGLVE
jgi:hypothetical protein